MRPLRLLALLLTAVGAVAPSAERPVAEVLAEATEGLSQFTFDWPRPLFREVRARVGDRGPEWQQATFGLAVCLQHFAPIEADAIAESSALFQELAEAAPESRWAPRAELNLGRLAELVDYLGDQPDLDAARRHYRAVMTRWPDQEIAGEAALRLAGTYVQTARREDADTAVAELTAWLQPHRDHPLAGAMWHWLGDVHYLHREDWRAALDAYLEADRNGLLWRGRESIVWWRMAVIAERLGDRATAIRYHRRICEDGQTSGKAFESQLALARLGVEPPELTAFRTYRGPRPAITVKTAPTGGTP